MAFFWRRKGTCCYAGLTRLQVNVKILAYIDTYTLNPLEFLLAPAA